MGMGIASYHLEGTRWSCTWRRAGFALYALCRGVVGASAPGILVARHGRGTALYRFGTVLNLLLPRTMLQAQWRQGPAPKSDIPL